MKSRTLIFPSILALLCSCAQASPLAGHDPIAVYISSFDNFATSAIKEIAEEVVKAKSYPCEVEVYVYDWDTAGFVGNPYDIAFFYSSNRATYVRSGGLVPIPKDVYESATKGMDEKTLSYWSYDGQQYSIPLFMEPDQVLYYDSSLISEGDVADWDKLCAAADKIGKKVGFFDVGMGYFLQDCYGAGAYTSFYYEDDSYRSVEDNFNQDAGLTAAKGLVRVLQHSNVIRHYADFLPPSYGRLSRYADQAEEQDVVAFVGHPASREEAMARYGEHFKMARVPDFVSDNGSFPAYSNLYAVAAEIFNNATMTEGKKVVCFDIVSALASAESQKRLYAAMGEHADRYGFIPTQLSARELLKYDYQVFLDVLDTSAFFPTINFSMADYTVELGRAIEANADHYDEENLKKALQTYHDHVMALEGTNIYRNMAQ